MHVFQFLEKFQGQQQTWDRGLEKGSECTFYGNLILFSGVLGPVVLLLQAPGRDTPGRLTQQGPGDPVHAQLFRLPRPKHAPVGRQKVHILYTESLSTV